MYAEIKEKVNERSNFGLSHFRLIMHLNWQCRKECSGDYIEQSRIDEDLFARVHGSKNSSLRRPDRSFKMGA